MSARIEEVIILGSGTSIGVPVIGCACATCTSCEDKNKRTRASILMRTDQGKNIVVDTSPEFRLQLLREGIKKIDAVIYTHTHADHTHGFDDLRVFYYLYKEPIDIYIPSQHAHDLRARFSYAFGDDTYHGTKPLIRLHPFDPGPLTVCDVEGESVLLPHGSIQTAGLRFGSFAYATDFKQLPPEVAGQWQGKLSHMVASGIRMSDPHPTHSLIPETIAMFKNLGIKAGAVTHLSHDVEYIRDSREVPAPYRLAFDGMRIDVTS